MYNSNSLEKNTKLRNQTTNLEKRIFLLEKKDEELKLKNKNEISKNVCKICYEQEVNTVILECVHRIVCKAIIKSVIKS